MLKHCKFLVLKIKAREDGIGNKNVEEKDRQELFLLYQMGLTFSLFYLMRLFYWWCL